eukprot:1064706-Prorocentrum_minimum.AAC.1
MIGGDAIGPQLGDERVKDGEGVRRGVTGMLGAIVWTLRAIVWMLRVIVWMLRAIVWMSRAIVWVLQDLLELGDEGVEDGLELLFSRYSVLPALRALLPPEVLSCANGLLRNEHLLVVVHLRGNTRRALRAN